MAVAGCSAGGDDPDPADSALPAATAGGPAPVTTPSAITEPGTGVPGSRPEESPPSATSPLATSTPETVPATTVPAPTVPAPAPPVTEPGVRVPLGTSVQGRPITALRRGTAGGLAVLVVGVIHGDEDAGMAVVDALTELTPPDGIELWLVRSMNPDGRAANTRQNANGVDLNRNFPTNWAPLAEPGDWQYAGPAPASEPEVQAMTSLASQVEPDLTLWYHQDLFRINPASGFDGDLRRLYADLTALPIIEVSGGTYTGTASQWSREIAADGGVGFTVELGATLSAAEARTHAEAVLTVADAMLR